MVFQRSPEVPRYADYTRYRPWLRTDFKYRCAYCLRHEGHNGGEANFQIEHHHPCRGRYGRPELESVYENLFWSCIECNQNKGDQWPSEEQRDAGYRFINPCEQGDDHDLHWRTTTNGVVHPQTNPGVYTIDVLKLWRRALVAHRAKLYELQQQAAHCEEALSAVAPGARRDGLEARLRRIRELIEPPVFDRPRGRGRFG